MKRILNKESKAAIELMIANDLITKDTAEKYFPELKEESKDERIKKELLSFLKEGKPYHCPNSAKRQEWAAWVEKQGDNMGISEATKKKLEDNLNKALEKETPESWNKFLNEQGEQNLTNEVGNYDHKEVLQTIINEQKPVWSKKDICLLNNCISLIEDIDCTKKEQNFLKSLKERYTWKPSEEQLKSLKKVINAGYYTSYPYALETLYEQLKQL